LAVSTIFTGLLTHSSAGTQYFYSVDFTSLGKVRLEEKSQGSRFVNRVILRFCTIYCNNRLSMGHRLPQELLEELRTYLDHFDQTGHLGESDTVAEIKRRLQVRIGEVEATLKLPPSYAPGPQQQYKSNR
jgi:hypothetical protein